MESHNNNELHRPTIPLHIAHLCTTCVRMSIRENHVFIASARSIKQCICIHLFCLTIEVSNGSAHTPIRRKWPTSVYGFCQLTNRTAFRMWLIRCISHHIHTFSILSIVGCSIFVLYFDVFWFEKLPNCATHEMEADETREYKKCAIQIHINAMA